MRHEPTHTEWLLWRALRCRQLGVTFRRQVVLQGYIADFYASSARLIVEVDGPWHARRTHRDARRDRVLTFAGYRILRVTEHQVLSALPKVVARIRAAIVEAH
jgi:very-short-patch-repair endonuclease